MGQPSDRFSHPWSMNRWIDGDDVSVDAVEDSVEFARDLAGFLGALHTIDARDGPRAGEQNFFRGGPVEVYDTETRKSIQSLTNDVHRAMATEVWDQAVASRWERPAVWVHGDVSPSNLLLGDGRLRAVIDFGSAGVGDPACDLIMAWTFFTDDSRETFRRALALDDATWDRARGWALWKVLSTLAREREQGEPADEAAIRFGWRGRAMEVLHRVLDTRDHA
jgi:aminoglycoside phosphotransferase (APT) family kinase protein